MENEGKVEQRLHSKECLQAGPTYLGLDYFSPMKVREIEMTIPRNADYSRDAYGSYASRHGGHARSRKSRDVR